MPSHLAAICAALAAGVWRLPASASISVADPTEQSPEALPVPPFPPRIAAGADYEACLDSLAADPASAAAMAETWATAGGGDGAEHCRGLALIALGQPAAGADLLEYLARNSGASQMARAQVLGQAAQAWLMVAQQGQTGKSPDEEKAGAAAAARAAVDAALALNLAPPDPDILMLLATAHGILGRLDMAVEDIDQALRLDAGRGDALVLRVMMHRGLNQIGLAQSDVARPLVLNPDDEDALLERGILRQRTGNWMGARADWEHARDVDPDSTTADLAEQNLSLLEAGPQRQ